MRLVQVMTDVADEYDCAMFDGIDDMDDANAIAKLSQIQADDARDYELMLWLSKLRPFYAIERRLIVVRGKV